jgi:hypothetical protein
LNVGQKVCGHVNLSVGVEFLGWGIQRFSVKEASREFPSSPNAIRF